MPNIHICSTTSTNDVRASKPKLRLNSLILKTKKFAYSQDVK